MQAGTKCLFSAHRGACAPSVGSSYRQQPSSAAETGAAAGRQARRQAAFHTVQCTCRECFNMSTVALGMLLLSIRWIATGQLLMAKDVRMCL